MKSVASSSSAAARLAGPSFPEFPSAMRGRRRELGVLARLVAPEEARVALIGGGGSGKSMLASALGHRVRRAFPGGIHWFRSGPWDARTLGDMMALRFGAPRASAGLFRALRQVLAARGRTFVVLDNHENDAAAATLLHELDGSGVTWVLTARRCLLGGVSLFPVVAMVASTGPAAFARVAGLAGRLRHSPLALSIADGIVRSGGVGAEALGDWLVERGVERVRVVDHEDDLPEVALLVDWAWSRLTAAERRLLAVLAHLDGDHADADSLATLARVATVERRRSLGRLQRWRLIQSPLPGRYAVHAVVRYAVARRTRFAPERAHDHYLNLLERQPERLELEQTHLYAAMDHAHLTSDLTRMLRIDALLAGLNG